MNQPLKRPTNEGILVLDYGSQYTLLIARRLREIGIYAEVINGSITEAPKDFLFKGVILSGGPDSVSEQGSRELHQWVLDSGVPILGICYGMQLLAEKFGGKLKSGGAREYGKATLTIQPNIDTHWAKHFEGMPHAQTVWMSHGDNVDNLTKSFELVGITEGNVVAMICHREKPYLGLQFHPEVHHSEFGTDILRTFIEDICKAELNWQSDDMLAATTKYVRDTVADGKVLMAVSGGVDSTVAVSLMARALGPDKVTAVFVDNGLLRKDEVSWVEKNLNSLGIHKIVTLKKASEFYEVLKGVTDPEKKRKLIGLKFIEEFEKFADHHKEFTHLGQGTLYPDVIESAAHGSGSKVIKSHHNVGGLPEKLKLDLVEPFRFLFKDEVRRIGTSIGIPENLVQRHPFPGPGLGVRILGEITEDKVKILQEADHIFIENLRTQNLYATVWQAFAVLLPVKTVGVMGDNRTYQWTCALRAVTASDGMTAGVGPLPMEFLVQCSDEIVRKVDGINRVVYDITTKPPATIEWE